MRIPEINSAKVKDNVEWLKNQQCGCCSFHLANTEEGIMYICIGWHNYDGANDWRIAWKIGMESYKNGMQTDLDIDFYMPYDEDGEVYDTLTIIEDGADFAAIADEMNKTAARVVAWQLQKEYRKNGEYAA